MPINPDYEELLELLEENFKKMKNLSDMQKMFLKEGLKTQKFLKAAKLVTAKLRQDHHFEDASILEDISPLFDAHEFWDHQPVPKLKDEVVLNDDEYNKPIEVKTLADVQQEPYTLP